MSYVEFYEKYWQSSHVRDRSKILVSKWIMKNLIDLIPPKIELNTVLEIGSGTGINIKILNELSNWNLIVSSDIAKSSLNLIKKTIPQAQLIQCDAQQIPIKDKSIDLILFVDILEHLEKPELALQHAKRIGKYTALKIPMEKSIIPLIFSRLRGIKQVGIEYHRAGHLYAWSKKDAFSLLNKAKLSILEYRITDLPEYIRYRENQNPKKNVIRKLKSRLIDVLEKGSCKYFPTLHRFLFGSNLFVFCKC